MLLIGGACSLLAASAAAKYPFRASEPELYPEWQPHIELEDAWGVSLPCFRYRGAVYVLAEAGERYTVRVHNPTSERLEAVVSVDGRDAVSGRVADYRRQRGYIVPPHASVLVDGFRRSLSEVAAFRFSDPADSYSARRGTPENVGVVGAAFFRERRWVRRPEPAPAPAAAAPAPTPTSAAAAPAPAPRSKAESRRADGDFEPGPSVNNLGTEYAERRESRVRQTSFARQKSEPSWLTTLRYDDADGLRARGIEVAPRRPQPEVVEPQAFPGSAFAEPPP